ncbi:MAG TPA: 2TM domain-containing protein [Jiangellales bacterium]|nr:2TM domain-containing protein [Jiangellales bacterium]
MSDLERIPRLSDEQELRELATKRVKAKRDLQAHVIAYLTVNLFLVAIWYATGASFFWPMIPILGWGIGLAFNVWEVYSPAITEDKVDAEMDRIRRHAH